MVRVRLLLVVAAAIAAVAYFHVHAYTAPSVAEKSVILEGVPHVRQRPDFCGEACAAMWLGKLGKPHSQDDVFNAAGLDPALGRGCYTRELNAALKRTGFETGDVWTEVAAEPKAMRGPWHELKTDLARGVPSIVCMRYDEKPKTTEHFRLVLGYDGSKDEVVYHEPAADDGAYRRMKRERFLSLWPLKYRGNRWTVVRLKLEGRRIPDPPKLPTGSRFTDADFAQHVRKLRKKLPTDEFTIVVEKPFVVVGDEPAARVRRRAEGTVRWAAHHLRKAFFAEDPLHILDVWLFRDRKSYEKHTLTLFKGRPDTRFGYYSSYHRALVMNIATGGGTLVHEMVHAYVEANFPECPPWLNEGLGSLFEACGERDGRIVGRVNWRLRGIRIAIRGDDLPSFEDLCAMDENEFYGTSRGDCYAQSRYLCLYLQERGRLRDLYRRFLAARKVDITGYATLSTVLGRSDMAAFKKEWEAWVMKLTE